MYTHNGWHLPDGCTHFIKHIFEGMETDYQNKTYKTALTHLDRPRRIALDIGGHVGLFATRMAKDFGEVHVFEPTQSAFECLKENTKSFDNIHLYNIGLGDNGTKKLVTCIDNSGTASAIDFSESGRAHVMYKQDPSLYREETITTKRLNSYDIKADLIKMDVQTMEAEIINYGTDVIQHAEVVIIECETGKEKLRTDLKMKVLGFELVDKVIKDRIYKKVRAPIFS